MRPFYDGEVLRLMRLRRTSDDMRCDWTIPSSRLCGPHGPVWCSMARRIPNVEQSRLGYEG